MTNADNPENTVPTSVFALCTLNDHSGALTVTTDYGTDPNVLQSRPRKPTVSTPSDGLEADHDIVNAELWTVMTQRDDIMDLIKLSDGDNSVRVHVLGRRGPGILPVHDLLDAEIIVESSFISGRLNICFYLSDLEEWSLALDALGAGQDVEWLDNGNGPAIRIELPNDDCDIPAVLIEDASGSGTLATIPIVLDDGWIKEQREHLREVVRAWPSEVLKTSPGAYEWRH